MIEPFAAGRFLQHVDQPLAGLDLNGRDAVVSRHRQGREVAFLIEGATKAQVIHNVFLGPYQPYGLYIPQGYDPKQRTPLLLDLHSMQYATAPLMLAGLLERSRELAKRIGIPELIMCDAGHAAGPRMRDYGGFGDPGSAKTALLIECGQHWEHRSAEVATDVMLRFLIAAGSVQAEDVAALGGPDFDAHPRQRVIEVTEAVTITGDRFDFSGDYRGLEMLGEKGSLIGRDGEREVRTPYDNCVLIMPSRRLVRGQTAVRLGRYLD